MLKLKNQLKNKFRMLKTYVTEQQKKEKKVKCAKKD